MRLLLVFALCELPPWVTPDFIFRVLESKIFSAISWGCAALVAIIGFIARMKYRDRNLKKLLDAYVQKAEKAQGTERTSVKTVIGAALRKSRGLPAQGNKAYAFNPSNVFEDAARLYAQREPNAAIEVLAKEADKCVATISYCRHQLKLAEERAATAYLEIGTIHREQGRGQDALDAFSAMLRVHSGDQDALRMRALQFRDLGRFGEAQQDLQTLLYQVAADPAATADIKRELAITHAAGSAWQPAFECLDEALKIETLRDSQRGIALTHEVLGGVQCARTWWKLSKGSYDLCRKIFVALGDREGTARIDEALRQLQILRARANGTQIAPAQSTLMN